MEPNWSSGYALFYKGTNERFGNVVCISGIPKGIDAEIRQIEGKLNISLEWKSVRFNIGL